MARTPPKLHVVNRVTAPLIVTQKQVDIVKKMQLYPDDLWVVTYPKAGTTWTQQIVRLIHSKGEEDGKRINEAVPYLEAANNPDLKFDYKVDISALKSPRAFKSHYPYELMPSGVPDTTPCKYIYVGRNPKDLAVSYYFHYLGFKYVSLDTKWDEFYPWFISGQVGYGDYFDHVLSWWAHRDDKNVLFMKYEDMKKDLHSCVRQISHFMGEDLPLDVVDKIAEKSTFSSMQGDSGANYGWAEHRRERSMPFMRKGQVGNWKEHFTQEQSAQCDAVTARKFKPVGLEFVEVLDNQ